MSEDLILRIEDLRISLSTDGEDFPAVEGLNLSIGRGEVFGLVGESGCGKSLTALSVAGLLSGPLRVTGGHIRFDGGDIARLPNRNMRMLRGNRIAMIFQEPMTALNPLMTIGDQIGEMFVLHQGMNRRAARKRAVECLEQVQVPAASRRVNDYPHQLSGGMRKRVALAQTLVLDPDIILMDEPFSALDVQTRQLMENEVLELWAARRKAVLFITHDLDEAIAMSDRVVVLSAGPATHPIGEFDIDLPRPRDVAEIRNHLRFVELHAAIWDVLREEVLKGYAQQRKVA